MICRCHVQWRRQRRSPTNPSLGGNRRQGRWRRTFVSHHLWPRFDNAQRALMTSQYGPLASAALTALPTSRATRIDPQPFRLFLCRRLHLLLSLSHRTCRCGRLLDQFGHHRAACPETGVLGKRGFPLECAAVQVCREGGARVSTNVFVRDMDLTVRNALDSRRLEMVADGLTLLRGAQLALDTTMVSPLRRDGTTRPRSASFDGAALEVARRRKEATYPILACTATRAFALSLLDRRPVSGSDAVVPSVSEVMRESRFC